MRPPVTATSAVQILTRDYKSVDEVWSDMEVRTRKEAAKAASRLAAQSSRTFARNVSEGWFTGPKLTPDASFA
jgi:hypothetical protein